LGQRVRLHKLAEDGRPTLISVYPEGYDVLTPGLFGGRPGGQARGGVYDPDGTLVRDCGPGELVKVTRPTEIVEIVLAGGAGYGDPRERDRALVERDVTLGLVTPEAAAAEYGWDKREAATKVA
jgi:5-oxoprolinase (ATP-hydrolysing)